MYDYGKCHVCGGKMEPKHIRQDFWIKGKLIVVEKVPAGVCAQCGEKIVRAEVGRKLAQVVTNRRGFKKSRRMNVPIIRFAEEVA
ncbi:MAG: type II toxin-antitoxin system MqsA family antitoxin [Nitrospiraceae bacterium]